MYTQVYTPLIRNNGNWPSQARVMRVVVHAWIPKYEKRTRSADESSQYRYQVPPTYNIHIMSHILQVRTFFFLLISLADRSSISGRTLRKLKWTVPGGLNASRARSPNVFCQTIKRGMKPAVMITARRN